MAKRRMFSLNVVDTDKFLDMPVSSQLLYFHLGMRADDDGFVASAKKIAGISGCNIDDLKLLIEKGYIISFEDGVIAITEWYENNSIRKDRYCKSIYTDYRRSLEVIDGKYRIKTEENVTDDNQTTPKRQPNDNQTITERLSDGLPRIGQDRIGQDRIGQDRIGQEKNTSGNNVTGCYQVLPEVTERYTEKEREKDKDKETDLEKEKRKKRCNATQTQQDATGCNTEKEREKEVEIDLEKEKRDSTNYHEIISMYNDTCVSFPRVTKLSENRKKAIRARLKVYTPDDFKKMFEMAESSSFLKGANSRNWSATFDWLINDSNMAKVLDGNYQDRQQSTPEHSGQSSQGQQGKARDIYTMIKDGVFDE